MRSLSPHGGGAHSELGFSSNTYEVMGKLAQGGMAEIFLARIRSIANVERHVVLKRVLPTRMHDPELVALFLAEMKLAAQLQHPNIAQVYDVGILGDHYFFTMEYVHGETVRMLLKTAVDQRRELLLGPILTIVAGAAAGLHHAHRRTGADGKLLGVVHCDISPSNLMVGFDGVVKVVDFGVAKASGGEGRASTNEVRGKVGYMSPEQLEGALDPRTDLFALGVVFWELLTRERLYRRGSDEATIAAIQSEPPPPPSHVRPEVPRKVDELVLRLLAKRPEDRPKSAEELVEDLEVLAPCIGVRLSPSTLGRFFVQVFGERPEPWRASQIVSEAAVTVVSELDGSREVIDPAATRVLEAQLSHVPMLRDPTPEPEVEPDGPPAWVERLSRQHTSPQIPSAMAELAAPPVATLYGVMSADRMVRPTAARPPRPGSVTETSRRTSWPLVLVVATAFGVLLAIVMSIGSGDDADVVRVVAPNADADHTQTGVTVPLAVDAAHDAVALDEAGVDAPDASTQATAVHDPVDAVPSMVPPSLRARVLTLIAAGQFTEAHQACGRTAWRRAPDACTRAACLAKAAAHAEVWYRQVASTERAAVQRACARAGVRVGAPPPRAADNKPDPCLRDPMRCR
jgi:serine/threonine-protein kinase